HGESGLTGTARLALRSAACEKRWAAMPDRTTSVADLRDAWGRFVAVREWNQFHSPKNLVMALACEAAELMEHFLWIDNAASHEVVKDAATREQVADELA